VLNRIIRRIVLPGASRVGEVPAKRHRWRYEGMLSAISVGFFLILIGVLFITTPNLLKNIQDFLNSFKINQVPSTNIYFPTPKTLADPNALNVYQAARQFSVIWGIFLVAMLGARLILGSTLHRLSENIGDIVFWLGAAYVIQTLLVATTQASTIDTTIWFRFWALIVALIGVSLIARGVFLAAARLRHA